MLNSVIKFSKRINIVDGEEVEIPDYFSKKITKARLYELIPNLDNYLLPYTLKDNEKIEKIAHDLYGSSDYWDLLVIINNLTPVLSMPYDTTVIDDIMEKLNKDIFIKLFIETYNEDLTKTDFSDFDDAKETTIEQLLRIEEKKLEKNRVIKVISKNKFSDVVRVLKTAGYIV